ncbi:WhiB family transcriptional regulator [Streptomyces sp. NPDC007991]|uniref:WhiB family transcriptional regulator n=1 Tax=Streptomyces sp. NPDC007991 TaxID=3364803 RepID=UPI0036E1D610
MSTPTCLVTKPASDWRDYASCREVDPELFFPVGNGIVIAQQTEQAKKVCGGCPVRTSCLEWALDTDQRLGVWGGLSEDERHQLATGKSREYRTSKDGVPAWEVIVEERLDEYRALEAEGLSAWEIGQRMRTNAHTIRRVQKALAEQEVSV